MALVLITTLDCSFTSRVPGTQPSPTDGNQQTQTIPPTQTISQDIQDISSYESKWDWQIYNDVPYTQELIMSGFDLKLINNENSLLSNFRFLDRQAYFVDNDSIYFSNQDQQPIAIDLDSGNIIWQSDFQGVVLGIGTDTVLIYRDDNRIYGLGKTDGQEKWKIIINELISEEYSLVPFNYIIQDQNDIIVPMRSLLHNTGFPDIRYLHVNETNGDSRLTDYEASPNIDTPFALTNGQVIATNSCSFTGTYSCGDNSFSIAGINPSDGTENWIVYSGYPYNWFNILETDVQNDVSYIELGGYNFDYAPNDFIALNLITGIYVWGGKLFENNNLLSNGPLNGKFSFSKNYIFFITSDNIFIFQKDNGMLISTLPQDRKFNFIFSENDGIIISYPDLGITKGIDPASSQGIWENDDLVLEDSLVSIGDAVIFSDKELVYAIDQRTGELLWKKSILGFIENGSIYVYLFANHFITYQDIILYKGKDNTGLYLLDPISGDNRKIIDTTLKIRTIQPLVNNSWLVEYTGTCQNKFPEYVCIDQLSLINLK